MCFRPANAAKPKTCPSCGAVNPSVRQTCIKCNADLGAEKAKNESENKADKEDK